MLFRSHIIKPAIQDYEDSVYNEYFSMRLAERLGLATAKCGLMRVKGRICYWTERFDREIVDGQVCRLHQEDFCQALGRPPEQKYQSEGGGFVKPPPLQLREKSQACYLTIGVKV